MASGAREAIGLLPQAFLAEKAGNAKACFQLDLTGDEGGRWVMDIAEGTCQVRQEVATNPDVTVTMDADDFVALFKDELDPVRAFMGGRIKVTGNLGLVMQLLSWFERKEAQNTES